VVCCFPEKCRSIADELMQNADIALDEVPNAAKVRPMLYFKQGSFESQVVIEAMEMVVGARASTQSG
jgi:hypothetical protein